MSELKININGSLYTFDSPKVMGILNVTPDSFFDGGKYFDSRDAIRSRLDQIVSEGADFIDVGAYSSRPNADDVSADEEWRRLANCFEIINKYYPDIPVSVDTFRAEVARKSVEQGGAAIINDISGGELDESMFETVADLHVPYILMHMQGTPQNMQVAPSYKDVTEDVITYLSGRLNKLRQLGVADVIIDPGFGFGKTLEHNYELFSNLDKFKIFELPILVGISRKSMIYRLIGGTPAESLNGTSVLNTLAVMSGAHILRVHDVRQAREVVQICSMINK